MSETIDETLAALIATRDQMRNQRDSLDGLIHLADAEIRGFRSALAFLQQPVGNGKLLHDWDNMSSLDRRCRACGYADNGTTSPTSPPCPGPKKQRRPRRDIKALVRTYLDAPRAFALPDDKKKRAAFIAEQIGDCRSDQVARALAKILAEGGA